MNFALLGFDPFLAGFARFLLRQGPHRLRWACAVGGLKRELNTTHSEIVFLEKWEELVGEPAADAVLVGALPSTAGQNRDEATAASDEIVRRLAQAGKHLLLICPEEFSLMTFYELAMIREETGNVIMPIRCERFHPGFASLCLPGASGEIEALRHVALERCGGTGPERYRSAGEAHWEGSRTLQRTFARDAFLLQHLVGSFTHVTALMAPKPATLDTQTAPGTTGTEPPESLCISMVSDRGFLTTWTAISAPEIHRIARLTITTDNTVRTLEWTDLESSVTQRIEGAEGASTKQLGPWDPAADVLNRFSKAVGGEEQDRDLAEATHCMELIDVAARSLRRGRAIELRHEVSTESDAFKGTMTSVGCGLLGLVLMALVVTAAAEGLGLGWVRYAWYGIIPLLVLFLVIQFLGLVSSSSEDRERKEE